MIAWMRRMIEAHRNTSELDRLRATVEERDKQIMLLQLLTRRLRDINADLDHRITELRR
jgi:hypothetical protein